jgi:hypothetical protein
VRDGRIVRDHAVANRRRAADDLRGLDEGGVERESEEKMGVPLHSPSPLSTATLESAA